LSRGTKLFGCNSIL